MSLVRSPLKLALLVAALVVGVQALLVPLFAAPAANLAPRDLPVVVAGPAPAVDDVVARLTAARPGGFAVVTRPDAAAADEVLRDRAAYAALVVGPDGLTLHTAPGASPTVAALLTEAVGGLAGGRPVSVVEVVPTDPDDPRGTGLAAGFLPLTLTSLIVGAALSLLVAGRVARLVGLVAYAVLAGAGGALVLHGWLGILDGNVLAEAAAMGLFALAASATVAGLGALVGRPGIGLGALLVFLVGNPLSAASAAPELLPQPWGAIGQWLPAGAGSTLLRSVAFLDGAGAGQAIAALVGYAVIGVGLTLVGRRAPADAHRARPAPTPGRAAAPATVTG